jgi:O-antigen/teichoic acid export membrane protein
MSAETKRKQIKNSIIYIMPMMLKNALPLITMPIFTRILSPDDYGLFGLALIFAIFMSGLANFGMTLAFERNYFQYRKQNEKISELLFSSILFVLLNFILILSISFLFRYKLSILMFGTLDHGNFLIAVFVAQFFFTTISQFYYIYFKNSERAGTYSRFLMLGSVIHFGSSLYLVGILGIGLWGLVLAQLISGVIVFLIMTNKVLKELKFSLNFILVKESLKLSYPLTPRIFLGVLNTQFDKYLIGLLSSLGGVGVYHIGKKVSYLTFAIMNAIENVFNPQVYKKMFSEEKDSAKQIGTYLTPFFYFSILITLSISLFSHEIITILTPQDYHLAIPIISLLSVYYGHMFFGKIVGIQLIYSKKTHVTSLLTISALVLNMGINIPMVMKYGPLGAAWGTLFAGMISRSISYIVSQRYYTIQWEKMKIIIILIFSILGGPGLVLLYQVLDSYLIILGIKILLMGAFLYAGNRFNILNRNNYKVIVGMIQRKKTNV